ncbi:MAG: cell division protein FtsZ [Rhodospirillales bacterium]|nr:cell division protein FtsZ [Rhodospirillales bacterium]
MVVNTDAQSLKASIADKRIQMGVLATHGLGTGGRVELGRIAAEESIREITEMLDGSSMVFVAAGLGGGTGTGSAPVIAQAAREKGILTVGVVSLPFEFEGGRRRRIAEDGLDELEQVVDTMIVIPNQNLFKIADENTSFMEAFKLADDVLYSAVRGITDLIVLPGLVNLDFADIQAVMRETGKAVIATGEAEGGRRAIEAAEKAIANPLLDSPSIWGAKGLLINITGGNDMTLFEVDVAANRVRAEVDDRCFTIFGSAMDETLEERIRVSVVASGIGAKEAASQPMAEIPGVVPDEPPMEPMNEVSGEEEEVNLPLPFIEGIEQEAISAEEGLDQLSHPPPANDSQPPDDQMGEKIDPFLAAVRAGVRAAKGLLGRVSRLFRG